MLEVLGDVVLSGGGCREVEVLPDQEEKITKVRFEGVFLGFSLRTDGNDSLGSLRMHDLGDPEVNVSESGEN